MSKNQVFLSIGTNVGNRERNIQICLSSIEKITEIKIIKTSSTYETESWGFKSDPFLNIVVKTSTTLNPKLLLKKFQNIEKKMGRTKNTNSNIYKDRVIDIDILFYDDLILNDGYLTIPHPNIQDRKFVLEPLKDIAPSFIHPTMNKNVLELSNQCTDKSSVLKL